MTAGSRSEEASDFPAGAADALWRALVDSVPYFVGLVSADGRLIYLNHVKGARPTSDFTGRSVFELAPEMEPRSRQVLARALGSSGPEELDFPLTLDGKTLWFKLLLNPIRDRDDRAIGVLAVAQDVTEARQTAIELRMSVNALHRLVEAREQLAADLHDGILQSLYGIGLRLEAARAAATAGPEAVESHLERAVRQVKDTMAEIRQFIRDERATSSLTVRWEDALAGVLRGLEVAQGPALTIDVPSAVADRVPPGLRNELVFIAREAVSNAMRHSEAQKVAVRLTDEGSHLRLEIEDDGRGFAGSGHPEGFGLLTMTRRAGQIGAILTMDTSIGSGTRVRLELPLSGGSPS